MQAAALLFLGIGVVNFVFAQRGGANARWNIVMGVVGVFAGSALAVLGDDGLPVLIAAVPALLFASYMHQRVPEDDDAASIDPPV